jgi:hypothetical protein
VWVTATSNGEVPFIKRLRCKCKSSCPVNLSLGIANGIVSVHNKAARLESDPQDIIKIRTGGILWSFINKNKNKKKNYLENIK